MSTAADHQRALDLAMRRLVAAGYAVERAPRQSPAELVVSLGPGALAVRVLLATAPHRRGGTGSLGLHWMLRGAEVDAVALVDLSREAVWFLPMSDFAARARPAAGGRLHLDWLVEPSYRGRSRVAGEEEFAAFRLDRD